MYFIWVFWLYQVDEISPYSLFWPKVETICFFVVVFFFLE